MIDIRESQCGLILAALQCGRRLTALEALDEFGCFRLAARIYDLREAGHEIIKETVLGNGKRHAEYSLPPSGGEQLQLGLFGSPNAGY